MSKATLNSRAAAQVGGGAAGFPESLVVAICHLHVNYYGTAEQFKDEGFIPDEFRWEAEPHIDSRPFVWHVGELRFSISRKRPPALRIKAHEWASLGLWHVRSDRARFDYSLSRDIREAALRLQRLIESTTPEGRARFDSHLQRVVMAGNDQSLQAFLNEAKRKACPNGRRPL